MRSTVLNTLLKQQRVYIDVALNCRNPVFVSRRLTKVEWTQIDRRPRLQISVEIEPRMLIDIVRLDEDDTSESPIWGEEGYDSHEGVSFVKTFRTYRTKRFFAHHVE